MPSGARAGAPKVRVDVRVDGTPFTGLRVHSTESASKGTESASKGTESARSSHLVISSVRCYNIIGLRRFGMRSMETWEA